MSRFFINRPSLVFVLYLTVLVTGAISIRNLTVELWPPVDINEVTVSTFYPGASPEEIEDLLTIPIEDELEGLDDVDYIESTSREGQSTIRVVFEASVSASAMDDKARDVQQRVNRAVTLPEAATTPLVEKIATENMPVVIMALSGGQSELGLKLAADDLKDEINDIPGVKSVSIIGARDREVAIEIDAERLQAYGLTPVDVRDAIAMRHMDVPAGSLFIGETETLLRVLGKPEHIRGLESVVVRRTPAGEVQVGDVARVIDTFKDPTILAHLNAERAVLVMVIKERDASTGALAERVKSDIAAFAADVPGLSVATVFDSSVAVHHRMRELITNGIQGFCLVVLILWINIGLRRAIITAVGIPMSFLGTFIIMNVLGISINFMTLYGMFLVLGILVDDAIVVIENITRLMEQGEPPKRAAILGVQQVSQPVVIAVTTTMVAFATMLIMQGTIGRFMSYLPKVVILVLFFSLVESLLLLPTHVAEFVPPERHDGRRRSRASRFWDAMQDRVEAALRVMLARPLLWFALPPVLLVGAFILAGMFIDVEMFPAEEPEEIHVTFELPPGSSIQTTEAVAVDIQQQVLAMEHPDIEHVYAAIGYVMDYSDVGRKNLGQVIAVIEDRSLRTQSGFVTGDEIRDRLTGNVKGVTSLKVAVPEGGPPSGDPVYVRVLGDGYDTLEAIAEQIKAFVREQPGMINVEDNRVEGNPELRIRIDEEKVARTGTNFPTVSQTLRGLFIGLKAVERRMDGDNVDITVRGQDDLRRIHAALDNATVPSETGTPVPLSALVTIERGRGPVAVYRRDGEHMVTVTADIAKTAEGRQGNAAEVNAAIAEKFGPMVRERYPGYQLQFGGEAESQAESFGSLGIAFVAAIFFIYVLLVFQFNTLWQPLVIMFIVPMTLFGVIVGMVLFGETFNLSTMIGIVALVGISVNSALVYIDYINYLRNEEGCEGDEALIEAARTRLRPIVLTALTTICGLFPMAARIGGGSAYLSPLASAIIYGLVTQTLVSLLFIPVAYRVVGRFAARCNRMLDVLRPGEEAYAPSQPHETPLEDDTWAE